MQVNTNAKPGSPKKQIGDYFYFIYDGAVWWNHIWYIVNWLTFWIIYIYAMLSDCGAACTARCQLSSRPNLCKRACGTCCARCSCVPPGTSGNRDVCPCYATMTTHGGKLKCPWKYLYISQLLCCVEVLYIERCRWK